MKAFLAASFFTYIIVYNFVTCMVALNDGNLPMGFFFFAFGTYFTYWTLDRIPLMFETDGERYQRVWAHSPYMLSVYMLSVYQK